MEWRLPDIRARAGEIANVPGITAPHEPPDRPDLRSHTVGDGTEANVQNVPALLRARHLIR